MFSSHTLWKKKMDELVEEAFLVPYNWNFQRLMRISSSLFCSERQEHLKNLEWHTFKVITMVRSLWKDRRWLTKTGIGDEGIGRWGLNAWIRTMIEMNSYNHNGYILFSSWRLKWTKKQLLQDPLIYLLSYLMG